MTRMEKIFALLAVVLLAAAVIVALLGEIQLAVVGIGGYFVLHLFLNMQSLRQARTNHRLLELLRESGQTTRDRLTENRTITDIQSASTAKELKELTVKLASGFDEMSDQQRIVSLRATAQFDAVRVFLEDLETSIIEGNSSTAKVTPTITLDKMLVALRTETQNIEALIRLYEGLEPRSIMPALGRWALDARSAWHLLSILRELSPKLILEVGGGTSTIWMGYECEKLNAHLISVDHSEEFLERTRSMVARHSLDDVIDLRLASLEEVEVHGNTFSWYCARAFDEIDGIDVLFIDGPPGNTGPFARYPAVPCLKHALNPDALVILDDADREDERVTVERWLSEFPELTQIDIGVSRLAVFRYKSDQLA